VGDSRHAQVMDDRLDGVDSLEGRISTTPLPHQQGAASPWLSPPRGSSTNSLHRASTIIKMIPKNALDAYQKDLFPSSTVPPCFASQISSLG
jgi:hypothetical protein